MKMNRSLPCVLLALTLTLPEITLAQATPTNDWIYPRPSHEDKLFVELKNGKTVTGNFYGISDTKLTLSNKNKNRDISRSDIRKIYRDLGKPVGTTTLKGAMIGGTVGAIAGGVFPPILFPRAIGALIGAAVLAAPGAATGFTIGMLRHDRQQIY